MAILKGKVAIVTGGGQGVGRGIALAMAKEGAAIAIPEINLDTATSTANEIKAMGGEHWQLPAMWANERKPMPQSLLRFGSSGL